MIGSLCASRSRRASVARFQVAPHQAPDRRLDPAARVRPERRRRLVGLAIESSIDAKKAQETPTCLAATGKERIFA